MLFCWFWMNASTLSFVVVPWPFLGLNKEDACGSRIVISSLLLVSAPLFPVSCSASGIAIEHEPSSIISRSELPPVPSFIPAFMFLSRYTTATVSLSLCESLLISSTRPRILDQFYPSFCRFSIDGSTFPNWRVACPILNVL